MYRCRRLSLSSIYRCHARHSKRPVVSASSCHCHARRSKRPVVSVSSYRCHAHRSMRLVVSVSSCQLPRFLGAHVVHVEAQVPSQQRVK